jgi:hypothetical protein
MYYNTGFPLFFSEIITRLRNSPIPTRPVCSREAILLFTHQGFVSQPEHCL